MTVTSETEDSLLSRASVCISIDGVGVSFAAVAGSEKHPIPGHLVQRCGVLAEICDQYDASQLDIPFPLPMPHAQSWLLCAELGSASDLFRQDDTTLVGALKVRDPPPAPVSGIEAFMSLCIVWWARYSAFNRFAV